MKNFPFIISAALIYWGYNSDHLVTAVIFAFLLEVRRFIRFRWDFKEKDFNYISMLSTVSVAGYIIYFVNTVNQIGIISSIIQFLPVILFPLNFFFVYSTSESINAKRLFLLFVTNKYSIVHPYIRNFRPDYFYLTATLIGGSISCSLNSFFILFALIIPVLIKFRSKNHSVPRYILSIAGVLLLSIMFQSGIYNSFLLLKDYLTDLYVERLMKDKDRTVQIGNIGSLKDNFRIELRAEIYNKFRHYVLLRDRVYNSYYGGRWAEAGTKNISFETSDIIYGSTPLDSLRIFFFSKGKTDYIKIPFGANDFAGIETGKTSLNSLGTLSASYSQYLIDYKTYSRRDSVLNLFDKPDEFDLKFNPKDSIYTDSLITALELKGLQAENVFFKLRNHFIEKYRYSLDYVDWKTRDKLKGFIQTKTGHCELFATLSCLVFRRLGFPSRYVTGYLLYEYSGLEDKYIARKKDRHAWIYVWDNKGNWIELDTTPPDISGYNAARSYFSGIYDFFSYIYYETFSLKKENNELFRNILMYSLIPLGLFLLYRILKDVKPYKNNINTSGKNPYRKLPELKMIEEKFKALGHKPENETLGLWFDRLKNIFLIPSENISRLKSLYYSKRYGKKELKPEEETEFNENLNSIDRKK